MTLIISRRQMTLLSSHMQNAYIERMVSRIRTKFPTQTITQRENELKDTVALAIEKAGCYGIKGERSITRYIDYMYTLGFDFDANSKRPWARTILKDPSLTEDQKVEQLDAHIYFLEGR